MQMKVDCVNVNKNLFKHLLFIIIYLFTGARRVSKDKVENRQNRLFVRSDCRKSSLE
jgi:hypothetical protein